ncbi:fimbrial major subunit CsuA/B family protein [Persephonella atlantica]|uniref:Fimbrial major subunit CsuA/B family protein n=1 Tax=Persephonella atlantica TaxID=2699429 RepID=A0ABS1GGN6_9AQUI|nr:fimbrial major subunit CsuA/B family protein [Persephonella atlantica]
MNTKALVGGVVLTGCLVCFSASQANSANSSFGIQVNVEDSCQFDGSSLPDISFDVEYDPGTGLYQVANGYSNGATFYINCIQNSNFTLSATSQNGSNSGLLVHTTNSSQSIPYILTVTIQAGSNFHTSSDIFSSSITVTGAPTTMLSFEIVNNLQQSQPTHPYAGTYKDTVTMTISY